MSSIINEIRNKVQYLASTESLPEHKAFALFYLEEIEDLSKEDAKIKVLDGPWDRGRDAVYIDEENAVLKIYQFKFSDNPQYVEQALTDVQRGVMEEEKLGRLKDIEAIELIIVSLTPPTRDLLEKAKFVKNSVQRWLRSKGYDVQVDVQVVDAKKRLLALYGRVYGIDVTLEWRVKSIVENKVILGLLDARGLVDYISVEELFAFNVRKFLGARKTTASRKMWDSLSETETRKNFWILNNGIVCLCTDYNIIDENKIEFKNFTVVNGAQTLGTIARFLEKNPTLREEPIWVVAKVLKVGETEEDVEWARKITDASNRQTPTSMRDLRAVDTFHRWIEEWLREEFNVAYLYKRGQVVPGGMLSVSMKELAQAYVAFWLEKPHISFARPGQIFSSDELYVEVFPTTEIYRLKESGRREQIKEFLAKRLLAWSIVKKIREYLHKVARGEEEKNRSLVYHMTWLYKVILEDYIAKYEAKKLYNIINEITSEDVLSDFYERVSSFFTMMDLDIPKSLKTTEAQDKLREKFMPTRLFNGLKQRILEKIEPTGT